MTTDIRTPASRFIERFGVDALARWTGRHRSRVHAWTWSTDKGGTGGAIPSRVRPAIVQGAKDEKGEDVAWADFEPQDGETYLMDGVEAAQ